MNWNQKVRHKKTTYKVEKDTSFFKKFAYSKTSTRVMLFANPSSLL